jgi:hypothetical protein
MDLLCNSILLQNMPKPSLTVLLLGLIPIFVTAKIFVEDRCSIKAPEDRKTWSQHYSFLEDPHWYLMYSGPLSFEHLPYTRCLENTTAKFDIAILGIPFDNKVSYRTGYVELLYRMIRTTPLIRRLSSNEKSTLWPIWNSNWKQNT